jgi:tryptophan synthase alpha chain
MTYYNPIFCFGDERFLRTAARAGVDGVIIPDLPPEEGKDFIARARRYHIDVICFIAPTTPPGRIRYIASLAKGFIYYVSLTGVTGARQALPKGIVAQLTRIKKVTDKPVCVGFGVSTPAQVSQIDRYCDGVIVGSAIVKKIKEHIGKPDLVARASSFVRQLKGGR